MSCIITVWSTCFQFWRSSLGLGIMKIKLFFSKSMRKKILSHILYTNRAYTGNNLLSIWGWHYAGIVARLTSLPLRVKKTGTICLAASSSRIWSNFTPHPTLSPTLHLGPNALPRPLALNSLKHNKHLMNLFFQQIILKDFGNKYHVLINVHPTPQPPTLHMGPNETWNNEK